MRLIILVLSVAHVSCMFYLRQINKVVSELCYNYFGINLCDCGFGEASYLFHNALGYFSFQFSVAKTLFMYCLLPVLLVNFEECILYSCICKSHYHTATYVDTNFYQWKSDILCKKWSLSTNLRVAYQDKNYKNRINYYKWIYCTPLLNFLP